MALWLDCDREGENIGFEVKLRVSYERHISNDVQVISLCNEWINYDNVYRAKFSALTSHELVMAYDNLAR